MFHHEAYILSYLRSVTEWDVDVEDQGMIKIPTMPLSLLHETNGGLDHNAPFDHNQLPLFRYFF